MFLHVVLYNYISLTKKTFSFLSRLKLGEKFGAFSIIDDIIIQIRHFIIDSVLNAMDSLVEKRSFLLYQTSGEIKFHKHTPDLFLLFSLYFLGKPRFLLWYILLHSNFRIIQNDVYITIYAHYLTAQAIHYLSKTFSEFVNIAPTWRLDCMYQLIKTIFFPV